MKDNSVAGKWSSTRSTRTLMIKVKSRRSPSPRNSSVRKKFSREIRRRVSRKPMISTFYMVNRPQLKSASKLMMTRRAGRETWSSRSSTSEPLPLAREDLMS